MSTIVRGKSAAYVIAFHLGWDVGEVRALDYQPSRYRGVYTIGDDYYCAPAKGQKPPQHPGDPEPFAWAAIAEYYGRTVYRAEVFGVEAVEMGERVA